MLYLLRLDDASEYMNIKKWQEMESLLDRHGIRPIVGVIPHNLDPSLVNKFEYNQKFWDLVINWEAKGWTVAMHGYNHVYETTSGGLNPVNNYSEFAGLPLEYQCAKIREGIRIFSQKGITPRLFFAPAHTFDGNTLEALRLESSIRVISDTVAFDIYFKDGFHFIPQQSGRVRRLPFKVVTFCYHPNTMVSEDFKHLGVFLGKMRDRFVAFDDLELTYREPGMPDHLLSHLYFGLRRIRAVLGRR